eukprot:2368241-Prorocentrum_lima.AAC.1
MVGLLEALGLSICEEMLASCRRSSPEHATLLPMRVTQDTLDTILVQDVAACSGFLAPLLKRCPGLPPL